MIFLQIALCVVILWDKDCFKIGEPPKKICYGCENQNSKFKLSTAVSSTPIWGKSNFTSRVEYNSTFSFSDHQEKLEEYLRQIIEKVHVNDVDPFLNFYDTFKPPNQSDILNFFKSFRVDYKSVMPDESLVIHLFWKILNLRRSSFLFPKTSMWFCAALADVPASVVKRLNKKKLFFPSKIPPFNYFDRVLGGIKISYRADPENTTSMDQFSISPEQTENGILLFHPGESVPQPILVTESKRLASLSHGPYGVTQKLNYNYLPNNKDYILTTPADYKARNSSDDWLGGQTNVGLLIYVGEPYCSIIDTTSKYGLLKPEKVEQKMFSSGKVQAGYKFSILPKDKERPSNSTEQTDKVARPYFELFLVDGNNETVRHKIAFESLKDSKFQTLKEPSDNPPEDEEVATLFKVNNILNYYKGGLLEKLEKIGLVVNDQQFLKDLESMNRRISKFTDNKIS